MTAEQTYNLLEIKSRQYYNQLGFSIDGFTEKDQARFGFYFFAVSKICNEANIDVIKDAIIDTDYCLKTLGKPDKDYGIDVVLINEDQSKVDLFSFKYRESYKPDSVQSENEFDDCFKFLEVVDSELLDDLTGKPREKAEELVEYFKNGTRCDCTIHYVSNESKAMSPTEATKRICDSYGYAIECHVLDDFAPLLEKCPEGITSKLKVFEKNLLKLDRDKNLRADSYILCLPLSEIIRITCKDASLRNDSDLAERTDLRGAELDLSVLFDNVRGYLSKSDINTGMQDTLASEPESFFMYNNGLTLIASDVKAELLQGHYFELHLEKVMIVNGGQTLRTIYEFLKMNDNIETLKNTRALIRLYCTSGKKDLAYRIAEYTNTQNKIEIYDLKSVDPIQFKIENALKGKGIFYSRKAGDIGEDATVYTATISMVELAQIRYSYLGYPHMVGTARKRLFKVFYEQIFSKDIDLEEVYKQVKLYGEIKEKYQQDNALYYYPQKAFYVVYLSAFTDDLDDFTDDDLDKCINLIENVLSLFRKDEEISPSRKLLQKDFKTMLDKEAIKIGIAIDASTDSQTSS